MSAPNTAALRNFKGHFRAAAKAILATAGLTDTYLERALGPLRQTARVEISFDLGPAENVATLDSGSRVYDYFDPCRLTLRVVTSRREGQAIAADEARDLHEHFVATVLDTFAEERAPFTEALLPYYAVLTLRPLGTRSDIDPVFFADFTDVSFALAFTVRPSAWPAGT